MLSLQKKTLHLMFVMLFAVNNLGMVINASVPHMAADKTTTSYVLEGDGGGISGECAVASSSCTGM